MSKNINKIVSAFFSHHATIILLIIFSISIAIATFIENFFDTATAKITVYNSMWFEILLLLLVINFLGSLVRNKLFRKDKLGFLLLHVAFILIIVGAAITRYIGFEADMHIREGESSNMIYSSEPFFQVKGINSDFYYCSDKPVYFSQIGDHSVHFDIEINNKLLIITSKNYIKNAERIVTPLIGDQDILELSLARKNGTIETIYLEKGHSVKHGSIILSYDNHLMTNSVKLFNRNNQLYFNSPLPVRMNKRGEMDAQYIEKDSTGSFKEDHVYSINGEMFLFRNRYQNAKISWIEGNKVKNSIDVLIADITFNNYKEEITLFYNNEKYTQTATTIKPGEQELEIIYGPKPIEIPFYIQLNDFILNKYPGSEIPSSYQSNITLIDDRMNKEREYIISKNNVLDYDGYRFFQTLYDEDEKGTILSVNHDFYGTLISFIGYLLLGFGFIILVFSKRSRFTKLGKKIKEIRIKRKGLLTILILLFSFTSFSNSTHSFVSKDHSEKFGKLIVQTYDGRFAPIHSLAYDVIHKISKKNTLIIPEYGKMNALRVFTDMIHNPEYWKQQDIIYIGDPAIRNMIGTNTRYASFNSFFNQHNKYKLEEYVYSAINKKQNDQSRFDKEILKLTERINIFIHTSNGSILKIFPEPNSKNNKWISWNASSANKPLEKNSFNINNYRLLMQTYLSEVNEAKNTNDYSAANKVLHNIKNVQSFSTNNLLPSELKINTEIFYNKAGMFSLLKYVYAILGIILTLVAIYELYFIKVYSFTKITWQITIAILFLAFAYHTLGLGLRWYLTNHAPWSNAYETLLLAAWGGLLAGFGFMNNSKLTVAATALLASVALMTAGHSNYDPQLTNIQPVLQSHWLIFHVATITIGYGILGVSFFLGIINLIFNLFDSNKKNINKLILTELTLINERTIYIGLILTSIGTFLGAVWANESWGRYWGWDPKETWSLIIILSYTIVLHLRLIPKIKHMLTINIGSIIAFGSVLMTFFGLNLYFKAGLHSYATDDPPIFPFWAWIVIASLVILIVSSLIKEKFYKSRI